MPGALRSLQIADPTWDGSGRGDVLLPRGRSVAGRSGRSQEPFCLRRDRPARRPHVRATTTAGDARVGAGPADDLPGAPPGLVAVAGVAPVDAHPDDQAPVRACERGGAPPEANPLAVADTHVLGRGRERDLPGV